MKKQITLTVGTVELNFTVAPEDYNQLLNELMPSNKVAPNHNFAMRTVDAGSKDELKKLFENNPGAAVQIGGALATEFAPALEITVKK